MSSLWTPRTFSVLLVVVAASTHDARAEAHPEPGWRQKHEAARELRRILAAEARGGDVVLPRSVKKTRLKRMQTLARGLGLELSPHPASARRYVLVDRPVTVAPHLGEETAALLRDARAARGYLERHPDPAKALRGEMLRLRGIWREHYLRLPYELTVQLRQRDDADRGAAATRRLLACSVGLEVASKPGGLVVIKARGAGPGRRLPLRRARVDGAARAQTLAYVRTGRVEAGREIVDGFALPSARNTVGISDGGLVNNLGEIVVVDRRRDRRLRRHLGFARSLRTLPGRQRADALGRYVHGLLTPTGWDRARTADGLRRWTARFNNRAILLGDVVAAGVGVCRHQALLFKVLGEEAGLDVALVAGAMRAGDRLGGHAWNELSLPGSPDRLIVDLLHPGQGYPPVTATGQHAGIYLTDDHRPMYRTRCSAASGFLE